ncbi:MAG: YaaA family protein [Sulfurovum sp.]|nr:YaaA family protein [Sulfurovum sp.]
MKILLAPSETKVSGGINPFEPNSLVFDELLPYRNKILHGYTNILQKGNQEELSKMFGLKKSEDIGYHANKDIINEPTMKAIQRYTGIAFEYLNYADLDSDARLYIDKNLLIFSNLFAVLKACDYVPEYRLQQGKSVGDIKPERFYKPLLQPLLDNYLDGEDILDIRAAFYDKYYKPTLPYTTLKFIKNDKVVSHWAKAYRGIVLREIAKAGIESIDEFMRLAIPNLAIKEIQSKKNKTEIIYEITQ